MTTKAQSRAALAAAHRHRTAVLERAGEIQREIQAKHKALHEVRSEASELEAEANRGAVVGSDTVPIEARILAARRRITALEQQATEAQGRYPHAAAEVAAADATAAARIALIEEIGHALVDQLEASTRSIFEAEYQLDSLREHIADACRNLPDDQRRPVLQALSGMLDRIPPARKPHILEDWNRRRAHLPAAWRAFEAALDRDAGAKLDLAALAVGPSQEASA